MAKRKKHKHKRGRRMGAAKLKKADTDMLLLGAGVIIGAFGKKAGDWGLKKIQDTVKIDQKWVNWGEAVVGGLGFGFLHVPPFWKGAMLGVAATGAVDGLIAAGALSGMGALPPMVPYRPRPNMNGGVSQTPAVGASKNSYGFPSTPGVGRGRSKSSFYAGAMNGK